MPEADLPHDLRSQVRAAMHEAWPPGPTDDGDLDPAHDPQLAPVSMLLLDGDTVMSALTLLHKTIEHRGQRYAAAGLSSVATPNRFRRKGYGERLVGAAHDAVAASGVDIGIFTCDRPLQAFYERCGWQALPGTVLIGGTPTAPVPSDQDGFDKVALVDFFSARARAHAADFRNARIALYPGEIDKLW